MKEARDQNEEIIPSLKDYHKTNIDPSKIAIVTHLEFNEAAQNNLLEWYNQKVNNSE